MTAVGTKRALGSAVASHSEGGDMRAHLRYQKNKLMPVTNTFRFAQLSPARKRFQR